MSLTAPDIEERRQFGRRVSRWLLFFAVLTSLAWVALTSYHFRDDLKMHLRLLSAHRGQVAQEYAPWLSGLVAPVPAAVALEDVLRARVSRPVAGPISVADVLVGGAVFQLRQIVPLIVAPGLLLLLGGVLLAMLCGRLMRRLDPRSFGQVWPAIAVPVVIAFSAGTGFGIAAFYFATPLRLLFGL